MEKEYQLFARALLIMTLALGILFAPIGIPPLYTNLFGGFLTLLGLLNLWYGLRQFELRMEKDRENRLYQQVERQKHTIENYEQELKIELWNAQRRYLQELGKVPKAYLEKANVFTAMVLELLEGTRPFWRIQAAFVESGGYYLLSQAIEVLKRITPAQDGRWVLPVQHGLADNTMRLAIRDITERLIYNGLAYRDYQGGPAYLKGITPDEAFIALGLDIDTIRQYKETNFEIKN